MARVLCKLWGSGVKEDPFRANFPSYQLVDFDATSRLALVEVRGEDLPDGCRAQPFNAHWVVDGPVDAIRLVGNNARLVTERINQRYREGFSQWNATEERG